MCAKEFFKYSDKKSDSRCDNYRKIEALLDLISSLP